ncbi:MAG: pimeloyl-ACP methyl ester esterase BioH, partial [Pseudomonadota bacterium]
SLKNGLTILETADFRQRLKDISCPFIRFYGRLDTLVPAKVIPLVNRLAPNSSQHLFEHCAHTPFVSASHSFADHYRQFIQHHD